MNTWPNYIHICDGKHVTIIRPHMWIIINPSMGLLYDMHYCQCLIITTRVPLVVNIIVQRLYINVALGILRWDEPLFE